LVICPNRAYHVLLHQRQGTASWGKGRRHSVTSTR
jgi:hypothetical protein